MGAYCLLTAKALFLPGQGIPWHDLVSRLSPTQSLPPNAGRGLVHVRTRCCVPVPHVLEHGSQSFQSLHSPSTVDGKKGFKLSVVTCKMPVCFV